MAIAGPSYPFEVLVFRLLSVNFLRVLPQEICLHTKRNFDNFVTWKDHNGKESFSITVELWRKFCKCYGGMFQRRSSTHYCCWCLMRWLLLATGDSVFVCRIDGFDRWGEVAKLL